MRQLSRLVLQWLLSNLLWDAVKVAGFVGVGTGMLAILWQWALPGVLVAALAATAFTLVIWNQVQTLTERREDSSRVPTLAMDRPAGSQQVGVLRTSLESMSQMGKDLLGKAQHRQEGAHYDPTSPNEVAEYQQFAKDIENWRDRVYRLLRTYDHHEASHFYNCPAAFGFTRRLGCFLERLAEIMARLPQDSNAGATIDRFVLLGTHRSNGVALLNWRITSDLELGKWIAEQEMWCRGISEFLRSHFGEATRLRFDHLGRLRDARFANAMNETHNHQLLMLNRRLEILADILAKAPV